MDNDLIQLINNRRTCRAFTKRKVSHKLINKIIDTAKNCPTGGNMQPWQVAILTGDSKKKLSEKLLAAVDKNTPPNPDYDYYPKEQFSPFALRRHEAGIALYHAEKIEFSQQHIDWEAVMKLAKRNYEFFGADIGLILHIDNRLSSGAHIDIGIFIQNIMLLAEYFGLSTCPQASMANYPTIVREQLALDQSRKIICGIGIGYAKKSAPINQAVINKEPAEHFASWYE